MPSPGAEEESINGLTTQTTEDRSAIDALVDAAREFGARGWTPATSGNYSVRLRDGRLAVTRSGADKRSLTVEDLLQTDAAGRPIGPGRPSAETRLHVQLYEHDAAIGAVLHVHSPAAVVASRLAADAGAIALEGHELLKAFEGTTTHAARLEVPVLANDQDMETLAAQVAPRLGAPGSLWTYLIAGHGVYAWGQDVASAARHLEAIEFLLVTHLEEWRLTR